jgi:hypothetical protein
MADRSPEVFLKTLRRERRHGRATTAVAVVALLVTFNPVAPPTPPVVPPERTRLVRARILGPIAASIPTRLRRWLRLSVASREIAAAPMCRSAHPALPTVGRPRDGPLALPGVAGQGA